MPQSGCIRSIFFPLRIRNFYIPGVSFAFHPTVIITACNIIIPILPEIRTYLRIIPQIAVTRRVIIRFCTIVPCNTLLIIILLCANPINIIRNFIKINLRTVNSQISFFLQRCRRYIFISILHEHIS